MVLRADCRSLQPHPYSEDPRGNGMSLSRASKMQENQLKSRCQARSSIIRTSLGATIRHQLCSKNSLFQQPAKRAVGAQAAAFGGFGGSQSEHVEHTRRAIPLTS